MNIKNILQNNLIKFLLITISLLSINFLLFYHHYIFKYQLGFPFDFPQGYFAIPFYWITCLQNNVMPFWIPQQAMGYPFVLNLQTSLFYPPLWLFVIFHKTYTLHAAVILQCLTTFFGAMGMLFFMRVQKFSWSYCFLAAIAFQFFGGFYSNAEHVDIIRGYAILPWLIAGCYITENKNDYLRHVILIPLTIQLLFSGAYPGIAMAALFMSGVYLILQYIFLNKITYRDKSIKLIFLGFCFALGVSLVFLQLFPAWKFQNEIARSTNYKEISHTFFIWKNYFTLFLSGNSSALPKSQDISMRTIFLTYPIFALLFFATRKNIKEQMINISMLVITVLMINGGYFYDFIIRFLHFLAYSRFPTADYRIYFAIFLLPVAMAILRVHLENMNTLKFYIIRGVFLLAVSILGLFVLPAATQHRIEIYNAIILLCMFSLLLVYRYLPCNKLFIILGYTILIISSGYLMWHGNVNLWSNPWVDKVYVFESQNLSKEALIKSLSGLSVRPQRIITSGADGAPVWPNYSWKGYLTGDFMLTDYSAGMQFQRQKNLINNPLLTTFMLLPSSYLLFSNDKLISLAAMEHEIKQNKIHGVKNGDIVMRQYQNNKIIYQIDLIKPYVMVENETYFPGWTAILKFADGKTSKINAIAAANLLRAWQLPAGKYEMIESFHMPYFFFSMIVSIVGFIAWFSLTLIIMIRSRKYY